ncbi:MAG TPA: hypothetical protein VFC67_02905 [Prolixibacteraceae bacterium]|nr:hypothetical protein [Prolixibacteraceae bacterium]
MKKETPKIIIVMEGGCITSVLSTDNIDVTIIDYDTEGCDEENFKPIPQGEGETAMAYVYEGKLLEINPERISEILTSINN